MVTFNVTFIHGKLAQSITLINRLCPAQNAVMNVDGRARLLSFSQNICTCRKQLAILVTIDGHICAFSVIKIFSMYMQRV